jgi:predicted SAM-dependent methyltransferase
MKKRLLPFLEFEHTRISLRRPIWDYAKVRFLIGDLLRNKTAQVKKWHVRTKLIRSPYLNVGCGPYAHPDFINIDYAWHPEVEICYDILKRIPLPDASLRGIFTEHCLEHITFDQCQAVLRDFYRLLQPGGTVRIIVPDAELYIDLYHKAHQGESVDFPYVDQHQWAMGYTPLMSLNRIFRDHGHLYAYDAQTMALQLECAGFIAIEKTQYRAGRDAHLLIDQASRASESLYIEASKPVTPGKSMPLAQGNQ